MSEREKTPTSDHEVVVGVDGSPAGVTALRYAIEEAERLGVGVHVVHAVQTYASMAPRYPLPLQDMVAAGREVLRSTMEQARPTPPSVPVTSSLTRGGAVQELASASTHARVVVVGSDRRPVAARLFTGNVSTSVAARAGAPVVAVPETWPSHGPTGVVLVGIKSADHSGELLDEAFAVARARAARLLVLHAWQLPNGYDDLIADDAFADWDSRARDDLESAVAPWRASCPDVEVELRTVHDQPAHALVAASAEADELVLVRRAHGVPSVLHLGPTARTLLAHAHCPVRVVPAHHRSSGQEAVREGVVVASS